MRFVDFLRMYIPYVNGYGEAMKALQGLQENRKWLKFAAEKKQQMGLDLMSFLIMSDTTRPHHPSSSHHSLSALSPLLLALTPPLLYCV